MGKSTSRKTDETNLCVKDVHDFIADTDLHLVYIKCAQEYCTDAWSRIPSKRKVVCVAEERLSHYESAVHELLGGREADSHAQRDAATPVTSEGFQAVKDATGSLVDTVEDLVEGFDKKSERFKEKVERNLEAWEKGCDTSIRWILFHIVASSGRWYLIGVLLYPDGEHACAAAEIAEAAAPATTATMEDEF
jgi:hypothetical protein